MKKLQETTNTKITAGINIDSPEEKKQGLVVRIWKKIKGLLSKLFKRLCPCCVIHNRDVKQVVIQPPLNTNERIIKPETLKEFTGKVQRVLNNKNTVDENTAADIAKKYCIIHELILSGENSRSTLLAKELRESLLSLLDDDTLESIMTQLTTSTHNLYCRDLSDNIKAIATNVTNILLDRQDDESEPSENEPSEAESLEKKSSVESVEYIQTLAQATECAINTLCNNGQNRQLMSALIDAGAITETMIRDLAKGQYVLNTLAIIDFILEE